MTLVPQQRPRPATGPEIPAATRRVGQARGKHRVRWVVAWMVVGLLVVVHVGGGWYFANQIDSSALRSNPATGVPVYDDAEVVAVSGDSVTLRRGPDAAASFEAVGWYGFAWPGGRGTLEGGTVNADGSVTRRLVIDSGAGPVAGQMAALDRSIRIGPGTELDHWGVSIAGLPAWYYQPVESANDTVAIFVHAQDRTRLDGLNFVRAAAPLLPNFLFITYRNDVGAPNDPSGRLQYGKTEWRDLDAAVQWAKGQGAREIILVGQSMGGAIIAAFMENSPQRDDVSGLVLDAPALSLSEMVTHAARSALPGGLGVPPSVTWSAKQLASLRFGADWSATDYLDDTSWVTVPTLVIHGTADPTVPLSLSRRLRDARPDLVQLEEFPTALHAESWNSDHQRYSNAVVGLFLRVAESGR